MLTLATILSCQKKSDQKDAPAPFAKKVYWLIPDGLRSDGELLDIIELAKSGQLPNFAKILKHSSTFYSSPEYPNHSSVNYASIVTGVKPSEHGIVDNFIGNLDSRIAGSTLWGFDYSSLKSPPYLASLQRSRHSGLYATDPKAG